MTTTWDIVSRVQNRVKDIPTEIGSAVIATYVEDAAVDVQNITGITVDLTSIGSSVIPAVTNMAAVYVLGYMSNVGVSYSAGRMRIDKDTESTGISSQMRYFLDMAQSSVESLGHSVVADKTQPTR